MQRSTRRASSPCGHLQASAGRGHRGACQDPVTDGKAPQLSDIDDIVSQAALADENAALVFSCQGGAGRTPRGWQAACSISEGSASSRRRRPRCCKAGQEEELQCRPWGQQRQQVFDALRTTPRRGGGRWGRHERGRGRGCRRSVGLDRGLPKGATRIQKLCHLLKYGDEAKEVTDSH